VDTGQSEPVWVKPIPDIKAARLCESVETAHASHEMHGKILRAIGITAPRLRIDSQTKYAAVATGEAAIYLRKPRTKNYHEKIWDHAAGSIVVMEAGGSVTDFKGAPLDFSRGRTLENYGGILATNGHIHEKVLHGIQKVLL
jgi:3'(2'), 5'-bisphosphate nucleotidase